MAPGSKGTDEGEGSLESPTSAAQPVEPGTDNSVQHTEDGEEEGNTEEDDDDEEEDSDEEEEAEEPRLKYAPLTKGQGALYRNGDAASAFLVSGDKMVLGTHNGNIHVFSLPSFQTLRVYHAHSASVTSISISPFPPPLPSTKSDVLNRVAAQTQDSSPRQQSPSGSRSEQPAIPNIPSNSIHIASSSIDGNVCVSSLVDSSDVLRRSFGRPVQSVALSPDYKNDRSYLSGGRAGSLILTVGGKTGKTSTSNTSGAAAAAGWLGSIGLGSHSGTDKELHSGEGAISTIKWSLTGKYVVWVNEEGIKIMRSNLHLDGGESEFAWKRMSHIDRPNQPGWEEMAGVWRARASWIDEDGLESTEEDVTSPPVAPKKPEDNGDAQSVLSNLSLRRSEKEKRKEKLVVGWGGTIWIIDIHPGSIGVGREAGERKIGRVEVVTKWVIPMAKCSLRLTDAGYGLIVLYLEFRSIPLIYSLFLHMLRLIPIMRKIPPL